MTVIPLTVTARNEERALGACLDCLCVAQAYAQMRLPLEFDVVVVLDECTDGSEEVARKRGVRCLASRGGKVEAQRRGLRPGPFQVFSDADVLCPEDALYALCEAMLSRPGVRVAALPKQPLPPRRRTPLAWALHVYNARRGFSSQRPWFSGKLFGIRQWSIPVEAEIAARARGLAEDPFHRYGEGLRVDDVYLSRWVLAEGGPEALFETSSTPLLFRAPETWVGMYRYYRRLRRELARMDALFPEWAGLAAPARMDQLQGAPWHDRVAWRLFQSALLTCQAVYVAERAYRRLGGGPWDPWPVITETKELPPVRPTDAASPSVKSASMRE